MVLTEFNAESESATPVPIVTSLNKAGRKGMPLLSIHSAMSVIFLVALSTLEGIRLVTSPICAMPSRIFMADNSASIFSMPPTCSRLERSVSATSKRLELYNSASAKTSGRASLSVVLKNSFDLSSNVFLSAISPVA